MRFNLSQPADLTYCTNVHPGADWDEMFGNIRRYVPAIRGRVPHEGSFGIGLHLTHDASLTLERDDRFAEFQAWLSDNRCHVFTLNGFPYGRFHGTQVKERVFAPDWTKPERLEYTNRLAGLLARMIPPGGEGSISTLPGSFEEWITDPLQRETIARNLADCAWRLETASREAGVDLHLGLEPEPMGMVETIDELIAFFQNELIPAGLERIAATAGVSQAEAEAVLRRRIGMCYDTCHMALEYEDAGEGLDKLAAAGVRVSKFQISSALRLTPSDATLAELARFSEGIYLHQVMGRSADGAIRQWKDIAPALGDRETLLAMDELRVHCHVPLFMRENRGIGSTADHITDLLTRLATRNDVRHFEIETYTWDVLPAELRLPDLGEAIAREYGWLLGKAEEARVRAEAP